MQPTSFQSYLDALHQRFAADRRGRVATYIPELAKADPDRFGIALVTVHGHVYQSGDSRHPFSIQSISKAFVYGMALEDSGPGRVAEKIDVEPSGEAFNSISLEPETGRPRNPMINAGAIVATSLVDGEGADEMTARVLQRFAAYAGRELDIDEAIYRSEKETGHRNRAIAHLLRNYELLPGDPEQPLDAYFRQCSILVTARDLALMGACLANEGVNPITGIRALGADQVPRVLSVMATCGMYDYSGNWIFQVGMPAKSGVGGGIVAVLPGQFGLAVYSPRLDEKWNSVRGIAVCEALSADYGTHMLRVSRLSTTSVIRNEYTADEVRSKLIRSPERRARIDALRDQVLVMELAGELSFVTAELVAARAAERMMDRRILILDLSRVAAIDRSANEFLAASIERILGQGKEVLISGWQRHFSFYQAVKRCFENDAPGPAFDYPDVDRALEAAEDALVSPDGRGAGSSERVALSAQALCTGLDAEEMACLESLLIHENFTAGETICCEGAPANRAYFLLCGRVTVMLRLDRRQDRRLGAFVAGSAFGESAFFSDGRRNADIVAETDVEVATLCPRSLRACPEPAARSLLSKLMENLAQHSQARLAQANEEIRALSR